MKLLLKKKRTKNKEECDVSFEDGRNEIATDRHTVDPTPTGSGQDDGFEEQGLTQSRMRRPSMSSRRASIDNLANGVDGARGNEILEVDLANVADAVNSLQEEGYDMYEADWQDAPSLARRRVRR